MNSMGNAKKLFLCASVINKNRYFGSNIFFFGKRNHPKSFYGLSSRMYLRPV